LEILPLTVAMPELVPIRRQRPEILAVAEQIEESLEGRKCLVAGVWLYVDDLYRSHSISQGLESVEGSLWHAVMHRREGDFGNSKYWLRQAGDLSILEGVYGDPFEFVDKVQRDHRDNPTALVDLQRKEWLALFEFCAEKMSEEVNE
jgi:hypothetical protein